MAVDASFFLAGERISVAACAAILESLGARRAPDAASADVVLASSDTRPLAPFARGKAQIVCDITAYGASGPLAGVAHGDALIQAISGIADTTGEPDAPPVLCGFPVTEGIAALYAAAGILTALNTRARSGAGDDIEVALFDCAVSTLTTFLPFHFVGQPVTRSGNRHVLASPWNIYRARDGWLLVCTGSDEQWTRLCQVLGRADLAGDPALATSQQRVARRGFVDTAVQEWIAARSAAEAAQAFEARGIASGPIVPAHELAREPNIAHRGLLGKPPIRYFTPRLGAAPGPAPARWPLDTDAAGLPLAGLRVLEIGQYTTAPLVSRQLGALGASVLKIEPPAGDPSRAWAPHQDGQSYFFSMSNTDKTSLSLDLRAAADKALFAGLAAQADVLVENLKPGSLARLGLGSAELAALNPRLVYCAVSGFGADSAYPGRPAFDTVIQAMSGIMDLIRVGDVPQKTGISLADVLGGLFGLVATLGALIGRERGAAQHVDMSMQDAAAWITRLARQTDTKVHACKDGYLAAQRAAPSGDLMALTRSQAVSLLKQRGVAAAPVLTVGEVAEHPHTLARQIVVRAKDSSGRTWPVFACPMRFAAAQPGIRQVAGKLGESNGQFS